MPNSPVYELHDAVNIEQVVHSGSVISVGEGQQAIKVARNPIRVKAWGEDSVEQVHGLGEDTRAVLRDLLGKDDRTIDELVANKIVITNEAPQEPRA